MTNDDNGINPVHYENDPANVRIRINPEIRIWIPDPFWLKLDALAEVCAPWPQSSLFCRDDVIITLSQSILQLVNPLMDIFRRRLKTELFERS